MKRMAMMVACMTTACVAAPALAQTSGAVSAYGSSFELAPFEKMETSVSVASDKNGRKFNVVKLPNGKMMALISLDKVKNFSPFADDSEMMFGGTKGSAR